MREVQAPPSKSATHRHYLLAARSLPPCTIVGPLRAADTDAMLGCLHALGAQFVPGGEAVRFEPAPLRVPDRMLDCRNAGTALRFLTATAATLPGPVHLDGDASLRTRPNGPLLQALQQLGARVGSREGRAPLRIHGPLYGGSTSLPAASSSQFASALLLALPFIAGTSTLVLAGPISRPYIQMTDRIAGSFGIQTGAGDRRTIHGEQSARGHVHRIEGDWSSAAFLFAGAAITGTPLRVRGLKDHTHGDEAILAHLQAFGATVDGHTLRPGRLASPGAIDVADTPDLFPALAAVAAVSRGTTTFTGGQQLRHKESDRIDAMATGLRSLGIDAAPTADGLRVTGGRLRPGRIECRGDHRIHIAFRLLGYLTDVTVPDDGCPAASYPNVEADLVRSLGP